MGNVQTGETGAQCTSAQCVSVLLHGVTAAGCEDSGPGAPVVALLCCISSNAALARHLPSPVGLPHCCGA